MSDTPLPATPGEAALALLRRSATAPLSLCLTAEEDEAVAIAGVLAGLAPELDVVHLPGWDVSPTGAVPPSAAAMGRRIAALRRLQRPPLGPRVVLASAESALLRSADPAHLLLDDLVLTVGDPLQDEDFARLLLRLGYGADARVDEPGEYAIRGEVVEVFPADAERPVRLDREGGRIAAIRPFDPVSQRGIGEIAEVRVGPASERAGEADGAPRDPAEPCDRRLDLTTVLAGAAILLAPGAIERARIALDLATEDQPSPIARRSRTVDPAILLVREAWEGFVLRGEPMPGGAPRPDLGEDPQDRVAQVRAEDGRVVLVSPDPRGLRQLLRLLGEAGSGVEAAEDWAAVEAAGPGAVLSLRAPLPASFLDAATGVLVLAAEDLVGGTQARRGPGLEGFVQDTEIAPGDVVVHEEHGLAICEGLVPVEAGDEGPGEAIRLVYADDDVLLVQPLEAGLLWRYGTAETGVKRDRLGGADWERRRDEVARDAAEVAARIAAQVAARRRARAPACRPDPARMARFGARFPHPLTLDQRRAVEAALDDLAGTRPMDRLVCGDVGFGKTEVALRAAAAVAFSGRQVAVAAPTTLLARQHAEVFRRRFGPFGITVGELSRFVPAAEAKATKEGLADGSVRIVVGTHALAGRAVRFENLGLVVVDEEQRFGDVHKRALRRLRRGVHALTMTATPIPRTLQETLAGLREVSLIATAPAGRRPVRTLAAPWADGLVRDLLMEERARGGRSFVVCPRVADIAPMAERLAGLVPELTPITVHARMAPESIDDAMLRFADGEADILIATSIIESGLDIPGADTMVIWHPERFGLAQLHQMRGRVGRGRARGRCLLATNPLAPPGPGGERRIAALTALDQAGAGFAVAARDLDHRGAGDVGGVDQTGHLRRVGVELSRHLLARAVAALGGEGDEDDWTPQLAVGCAAALSADYVPEPELRLSLYRRAMRLPNLRAVEAFADELDDRFGEPPEAARLWLDQVRVTAACRALGIARLEAGPKGLALTPRGDPAGKRLSALAGDLDPPLEEAGERWMWPRGGEDGPARVGAALALLKAIAGALAKRRKAAG
ncbi:DEAD/DEAH box helicase [uncultured Alsobacter sp.]|uniref:DEAD/DEAH box helicase n=1 Tax=uncultured Alsobacter sp. TaxID=1748258 RepID=UPI0025CD6CCE|nr:DEAD/DEAH box helicase [uncultured Alsobacter sp.]